VVSAPPPTAAHPPRPVRAGGAGRERAGEGDGLARAGIVLGVASLPILQPAFANNLTPADLGLVLAIAMVLLWAGSTRLRLPFAAGALVTVAVYSLTHEVLHERPLWTLLGLLAAFGLWSRSNRSSWGSAA
jgi:hypothetical protein